MDRTPVMGRRLRQTSITFQKTEVAIKTECKDDEEENENDSETNSSDLRGSFLCEFCDSNSTTECFESKADLIIHCLRNHPTSCVGCFEMFASSEDLLEHLEAFPHEPPVCRACCRSFASALTMKRHRCPSAVKPSAKDSKRMSSLRKKVIKKEPCEEVETEDRHEGNTSTKEQEHVKEGRVSAARKKARVASFNTRRSDAKEGWRDSEDKNREAFCAESEDEFEEKYVPEETSGESDSSVDDDDDDEEEDEEDEEDDSEEEGARSKQKLSNFRDVTLQCMHCSFETQGSEREPSVTFLRNHTVSLHPTVCGICFEGFENADSLTEHQRSMNHKYKVCNACDSRVMFMKNIYYFKHIQTLHPEQCRFRCPDCPSSFLKKKSLAIHRRSHDPNKWNKHCKYGEFGELHKRLLRNVCTVCDYSTQSSLGIAMHMYEQHPGPNQIPKFKCDKCQIGYRSPYFFSKHILKKHFEDEEFRKTLRGLFRQYCRRYKCESCCKSYRSMLEFTRHLCVIHRSSIPFHCSICSAGFLDSTDLRIHECVDHKNTSPFVCDKCNLSFPTSTRLFTHFRKTHKWRTVPLVYCYVHEVGFSYYTETTSHFALHHKPPRPKTKFECKECGKVLSTKARLVHIATHDLDRPYEVSLSFYNCRFYNFSFDV